MGTLDWTQHKQGSAELTLTDEKMANIHPLLREEMEHSSQTQQTQSGSELFSRIDPNKLHGALETAAVLSTVEQEGVPTSMLPVQAVANKKQEPAEKEPTRNRNQRRKTSHREEGPCSV